MKNQVLTRCLLALLFLALGGCRSPDELNEIITAQVFVIGVEEDQWVELEIEDSVVATESHSAANLLQFSLALDPGIHEGMITVFELERNERRQDDDGWHRPDDDEIEALRCGDFSIEIPEQMNPATPVSIAIVVEDLGRCEDEEDDEERERRNQDNDRSGPQDEPNSDFDPDENHAADDTGSDEAGADDVGPDDAGDDDEDETDQENYDGPDMEP